MDTDNLLDSRTPADGVVTKNPTSARGGLWKVGIAAAVVAASVLVFMSGCRKRDTQSSRSPDADTSSEREYSEEGRSAGLKAGDTKMFTLPGGVEMEMVYVAPGSFTMGSPESEAGREEGETQHRVTLSKGFWLGKYPVTQRQWQALVRANGVTFAEGEPVTYFSRDGKGRDVVSGLDTSDFPMESVSWNDCKALVDALNKNERGDWHWSFPTEAQWEFAARGGTNSCGYTYSGGNDLDALGWYYENSGLRRLSDSDRVHAFEKVAEKVSSNKCRTHSVREKDVGNELGIVGMSGNVWEWCADWHDEGYYAKSPTDDPCNTASGAVRVLRGGGWSGNAQSCRSADRRGCNPVCRDYGNGFRLCCSAGPRGRAESGGPGSHRKVQLWEGGPYWAEANIGAENPEDCGYYFWWGDVVGYKREGNEWVASNGLSRNFSFDSKNVPTFDKEIDKRTGEEWLTKDGTLAPKHDAAHEHWGGDWRMPTDREMEDLLKKCDWEWTTIKSVKGYVVRGRGKYASASIFLPCAGYGHGTSLSYVGSYGLYWSSVPYSAYYYAWYLFFYSGDHNLSDSSRCRGQTVRPVQGPPRQGGHAVE